MPKGSQLEENLETGGGYGKFVFVNHNDDDSDGVPDYANRENEAEGNFVPVVLKINIPDVNWSEVFVTFLFDGPTKILGRDYPEIVDPRLNHSYPTGFRDFRNGRRTGDETVGWKYPGMQLWAINDPSDFRLDDDLLFSGQTYTAIDLGFGHGGDPNEMVFYVEGLNQGGGSRLSPQPTTIGVEVQSGGNDYSDQVRLTVVEANLGVNNSSHEPFDDEFTNYGTLRPGIPDTGFVIDQYDEIVEDQGEGFVFWKPSSRKTIRPIDMFPIAIDIPLALRNSGYEFFLRTDIEDSGLLIGRDYSSAANPIGYINEESKFVATISYFSTRADRLSEWVLPKTEIGTRSKYLLYPRSVEDLTSTDVTRIQLVGRDRSRNEVVVDSFRLTLRPLVWEGQGYNGLFWMGSARGELGGTFDYPADLVAGGRVRQDIQIYPQFSWVSGPDPDEQKELYLAYIHGFNINPDQAFRDSAEIFKRMWWSGYRGNFFALTWHGDEWDPLDHKCDEFPGLPSIACLAQFFPNMENAMQTSPRLRQFIVDTSTQF
jgi:hypothetical protein